MFNITADNIHVYNLTIRCKTLTHDAKYAINGEIECNIWSQSLAKACSLNCVHNVDHPIKKNAWNILLFSSTTKKNPVTCAYSTENEMLLNIYRKYKWNNPNEVGMNLHS
jgi:hypothetical protein